MYRRYITNSIIEALEDTPVILINGARQTGKSTLCSKIVKDGAFHGNFVTMDDPATLLAAQKDPLGFLIDLGKHVIIDEIQRAPELFLPIKKLVDEDRKGVRFILTGSADVMMLPKVADSLAGRIEIHNLWPLSQDEIEGERSEFLDILTDPARKFASSNTAWKEISAKIQIGGYPESLERYSSSRRNKWFANYITAILQKDIKDLANIEGLAEIPNILNLIATRVSSTINMSEISRLSGVKYTTLKRYMTLLELIFMTVRVPAWTKNMEGEFVKSPKIYLNDTGLLNYLIGKEDDNFLEQRSNAGAFLENFVVLEILKQMSWSKFSLKPYHFSIHKGAEVDLVLEDKMGNVYGIEIKSTASLQNKEFKSLKNLSKLIGDKFKRGIVLYTGDKYLGGFGQNLQAVPISAVWSEKSR